MIHNLIIIRQQVGTICRLSLKSFNYGITHAASHVTSKQSRIFFPLIKMYKPLSCKIVMDILLRALLCSFTDWSISRRGYEVPKTMAATVRPNQVNQVIRHPRATFRVVVVNVNKRSVSADARAFIPNYLLRVDLFDSKRIVEG